MSIRVGPLPPGLLVMVRTEVVTDLMAETGVTDQAKVPCSPVVAGGAVLGGDGEGAAAGGGVQLGDPTAGGSPPNPAHLSKSSTRSAAASAQLRSSQEGRESVKAAIIAEELKVSCRVGCSWAANLDTRTGILLLMYPWLVSSTTRLMKASMSWSVAKVPANSGVYHSITLKVTTVVVSVVRCLVIWRTWWRERKGTL